MIILPPGPRRKWLMSFWLAISLVSGALCGAMLAILIAPAWLAVGGIVALVVAVPGLRRPQTAARAYHKWRRAARSYCRVVGLVLTGICFYTVFVVARLAGSSLGLARPRAARTMWVPRTTLATTAYTHQYNRTTPGPPRGGWLRTYLAWTVRSGHVWAASLLPFLILLEIVEPDPEQRPTANIYTLF
jgi:hypothetical protein